MASSRLSTRRETDQLTKALNRFGWERRAKEAMSSGVEYIGLAMIDLDEFKIINDTRGHLEGDRRLREAAYICRTFTPHNSVVARLGGDEFGILVPGDSSHMLAHVFDELTSRIPQASVGVAIAKRESSDLLELMRLADARCYKIKSAKRRGG